MKSIDYTKCDVVCHWIPFISFLLLMVHCGKERHAEESTSYLSAGSIADTSLIALSAGLLYESDLYHEASIGYGKLINVDSTNGKYLYRKAYCLVQIDSLAEAKTYYLKAAKLMYKEAECYYAIGGIFVMMGKESSAVPFLQRALKLNADMEKARKLLFDVENGMKPPAL